MCIVRPDPVRALAGGKSAAPADTDVTHGAELTAVKTDVFSYSLMSKWPVNKENAPKTDADITGLDRIENDPLTPFCTTETIDGIEYFNAYYADMATSPACMSCHNNHAASPRRDFEFGDVMGGVVVRIPLSGLK